MTGEIITKLQNQLNTPIESEVQVVYILSRIRKIIEADNQQEEFRKLKFFCDWALHSEIGNTSSIRDLLDRIRNDEVEAHVEFLGFIEFHTELQRFLNAYNLLTTIYEPKGSPHNFNKFMSAIYSDTPLLLRDLGIKISWKGEVGKNSYGGGFYEEPI